MEAIGSIFSASPPPFSAPISTPWQSSSTPGWAQSNPVGPVFSEQRGGGSAGFDAGFDFDGILGGIGKAFSAYQNASDQAALIEANARLMEQRARDDQVVASVEASRERRRNRALISMQMAQASQAGAYGTPLDVAIPANAAELELDTLTTKYSRDMAAKGLTDQARLDRFGAGQVRAGGRTAAIGGFASGLGKLFKGASFGIDPLNISLGSG